jgi:hypothetical protein
MLTPAADHFQVNRHYREALGFGRGSDAPGEIWPLRIVMLQVINGIAFSVSQPVEHPLRRFPADFSVRSQVPHRVSGLLEFGQDLGDEDLPAFRRQLSLSLLARDIYPELQLFGHP